MDRGSRDLSTEDQTPSSSSSSFDSTAMSDALLFTTICMIGLPVDVHVKDGSVYSGIFHTASVGADYGVVLKKARITKKGTCSSNVGKEGLVDLLLIPSHDLVQVVCKGETLPSDVVGGKLTGDSEEAVCSEILTPERENDIEPLMDSKWVNQSSMDIQAGDEMSKRKADDCRQKSEFANERSDEKIQSSNSSHEIDTCHGEVEAVERGSADTTSSPHDNGLLCNNAPASIKANNSCSARSSTPDSASTNSTQGVDLISESRDLPEKSVEISTPQGTDSTSAKKFKLNPAAKTFSPSFVNPILVTTALPTTANMVYIPNSSPMLPAATNQPDAGFNSFASRPSAAVKVAQYNNFTVRNSGTGSQFSQPVVGQLAHRTQPLRYAAHYDPILSEPAYLQPSSPAVMVGRSAQAQPISHDWIHGATAISPVSARPLQFNVQYPKQQGGTVGQAMPVGVPPHVLTSGQQPFALHSHIPFLQPGFPLTRPISVPGPHGFYGTKFS